MSGAETRKGVHSKMKELPFGVDAFLVYENINRKVIKVIFLDKMAEKSTKSIMSPISSALKHNSNSAVGQLNVVEVKLGKS